MTFFFACPTSIVARRYRLNLSFAPGAGNPRSLQNYKQDDYVESFKFVINHESFLLQAIVRPVKQVLNSNSAE